MFILPTVAAFDFDCTLTHCDTLLPFLYFREGKMQTRWKLFKLTPSFVLFFLNLLSRKQVKESILTAFFRGVPRSLLEEEGALFAARQLNQLLRKEAMERLAWHQAQGHRCILISASIETYLAPWAKAHGFETALCSRLAYDPLGRATGLLEGQNCWGEEKRRRLIAYLGERSGYRLYAYGDSRGDRELLACADDPFFNLF